MAMLTSDGVLPTLSELAAAASVSRATVYRYFQTRSALIAAVMDQSLGPMRTYVSPQAAPQERIRDLLSRTVPRFSAYEVPMRAALQLSLEHWMLERSGKMKGEPYRRGFRVKILDRNLDAHRDQLAPDDYRRLHQALSVIYGIESFIVLRDLWQASDAQIAEMLQWMAEAFFAHAARDRVP